jgi:hypothetical protein
MNANDILLWMSAKRSGSWAGYKDTLEEMSTQEGENEDDSIDSDLPIYQRLRFNLERLAHVEFNRHEFRNGWRIVPPTLAITSGKPVGILCGARTEQLVARIQEDVRNIRFTPQTECPDCIEVLTDGDIERIVAGNGVLVQHHATESLLAALPPLDDRQMRNSCELPFGNESPVHQFSTSTFEWTSCSPDEARKTSFGLFRWQLPYEKHYYLKGRVQAYRVPVQVGKYLALRHDRRRVITFDQSSQTLTVPVTCRPPILIDRALTLRTGLIPDIEQGKLVYRNINAPIGRTTTALLRQ